MKKKNMAIWLVRGIVLIVISASATIVALQAHWNEPSTVVKVIGQQDKEKEVQLFMEKVTAAFSLHDAKAVGELFLLEGELIDANGNVLKTRDTLEAHYAEIFKSNPQARLALSTESVRLIGNSLAMYDGIAEVKLSAQVPVRRTRFGAVLSKQDNQWQIASIRDLEEMDNDPIVIQETLASLGFLTGQWVEEGGNYRIHTDCRWSEDKMTLTQTFKISSINTANVKDLSGTQRISWDPATQKVKSWSHDTQGGYTEALWTKSGNNWIVKSIGTTSAGDACSMTSVYKPVGNGRIDIFFRDRIVGDEVMPDTNVTIVRKPPESKP